MLKVFLPGQKVPSWLERIEKKGPDSKIGSFTFRSPSIVYIKNGHFYIREIIGDGAPLHLKDCDGLNISGQLPAGGDGEVFIIGKPLLTWTEFILGSFLLISLLQH